MTPTPTPLTKHVLGFTIVAQPHSHHVDYTTYSIAGHEEGATPDVFDVPLYERSGPGTEVTDDLTQARVYLHGHVKWDGCSNWYFDEQDVVMLHGCSRENLTRIGDVLAVCWDWTAELCPAWNAT